MNNAAGKKRESKAANVAKLAAALDTRGAVIGACGLFFFALTVHSLLPTLAPAAVLGLATIGVVCLVRF
jgi:hypothetical protein